MTKIPNTMSLKEHIKGNVTFVRYFDGDLWYVTETNYEFPVPISDTAGAVFKATDKGILFMRYIRKQMELIASVSMLEAL